MTRICFGLSVGLTLGLTFFVMDARVALTAPAAPGTSAARGTGAVRRQEVSA